MTDTTSVENAGNVFEQQLYSRFCLKQTLILTRDQDSGHGLLVRAAVVRVGYRFREVRYRLRRRSVTARDQTNSCVQTCELLRRHISTSVNTSMLPSVPTTKTIHRTTTVMCVSQSMYENSHEAGQLAVVPVEFQALFSTELRSRLLTAHGLDKFILTCSEGRLFPVDDEIDVLRRLVLLRPPRR